MVGCSVHEIERRCGKPRENAAEEKIG